MCTTYNDLYVHMYCAPRYTLVYVQRTMVYTCICMDSVPRFILVYVQRTLIYTCIICTVYIDSYCGVVCCAVLCADGLSVRSYYGSVDDVDVIRYYPELLQLSLFDP